MTGTSVALGNFDGFHKGHLSVILKAVSNCGDNLTPTILHFDIHPSEFLTGKTLPKIMSDDERAEFLNLNNINQYTVKFSEIRNMTAEKFVEEILINTLNAKFVACGFNFHFGLNATGNCEKLKELCEKNNIKCAVLPAELYNSKPISSSRIREAIKSGNVKDAYNMLGRYYTVTGEIVNGQKLGRKLGFPTINQDFDMTKVVPKFGVYKSTVKIHGKEYKGMTNIGVKPTVGSKNIIVETNILNFNEDVYGESATLELKEFIRPEKKFSDIDELRRQVLTDISKIEKDELNV